MVEARQECRETEEKAHIAARLKNVRKNGKLILSTEGEAALVTLLKVCSMTNHALRKSDIIDHVRRKHMQGDLTWRGDKWLRIFLRRNKVELKSSNLKVIAAGRVDPESQQSVEEFIAVMEETVLKYNMTGDTTINVDEFQLKVSGYSAGKARITAVRKNGRAKKQVTSTKRGGCVGSLIAFISASGSLMYSALCLKPDALSKKTETAYIDMDELERRGINTRGRPIPQLRIYTESGMIDNKCWRQIWSHFTNFTNDSAPGLEHVVYMDNLAQHTQLECIEEGLEKNVHMRLLPKGTSQYSQACDSYTFATARKEVNKSASSKMVTDADETLNHIIRDIVPDVLEKAFTPTIIKASFSATGLYPFNANTLRSNCRENLGLSPDMEEDPLVSLEDKVTDKISDLFRRDTKKPPKRKRVLINLRQAYTSGHIIQASKEDERRKAEEKRLKLEKQEAVAERKRQVAINKHFKKLAVEARVAERKRQAAINKQEKKLAVEARKQKREEIKQQKLRDKLRNKKKNQAKKLQDATNKNKRKKKLNTALVKKVKENGDSKGIRKVKRLGVRCTPPKTTVSKRMFKTKCMKKISRGRIVAARNSGKVRFVSVLRSKQSPAT